MHAMVALAVPVFFLPPAASQDTLLLRSSGPGLWRNPHLVEDLRIGVPDGDDNYVLGQVDYFEVASDGSLWIADTRAPRLRILDRNGRYVRDVSRPGTGPGEIRGIMGLARTPDRHVAVWDLPNGRVSIYTEAGEFVRAFSSTSDALVDNRFRVDFAGRYWIYTSVLKPSCIQRVTGRDGRVLERGGEAPGCRSHGFLRYSRAGTLLDTAIVPLPEQTARIPGFAIRLPEGSVRPFTAEWYYALGPSGCFVTAYSPRFALNVACHVDRQKPHIMQIQREYVPVRLGAGERREWQSRADYITQREKPGGISYAVPIPDVKPAIRSVSVDGDGRIWVDRYVAAVQRLDAARGSTRPNVPPPLTWREPRTFDVFAAAGQYLGTVIVPPDTRLLLQRGNSVWGVLRGQHGESYVVHYRLVTNWNPVAS